MAILPPRRGVAAPCFADEPAELVQLGVASERAGFDGFFLWDHMVFDNAGHGPSIVDPWLVLALIAAATNRIRLGTVITPLSRRRPWVVARQTATLDRLSGGRLVLGVGLGSPAYGDFGIFGEASDAHERAELLDEGLDVVTGLWSGETFSYAGRHYRLDPVRFTPRPVQHPRPPVWVGGVLPAKAPINRAARWDGAVPIRFVKGALSRPSVRDIAGVRERVLAHRSTLDGYDLVVWADVAAPGEPSANELVAYADAGATWWIETARPGPSWYQGLQARIERGP